MNKAHAQGLALKNNLGTNSGKDAQEASPSCCATAMLEADLDPGLPRLVPAVARLEGAAVQAPGVSRPVPRLPATVRQEIGMREFRLRCQGGARIPGGDSGRGRSSSFASWAGRRGGGRGGRIDAKHARTCELRACTSPASALSQFV